MIDTATAPIDAAEATPLVSVFMFVRNGAATIRRAIDSVLAQTHANIEFIVQDGASTDGTLDILRSYGDRLKIVSEPDNGPSDGLWRALHRCSGEFIGSCQADEELLPDATERAIAILRENVEVGAVTGDAMITDINGRQTGLWTSGPFNLVDYLMADYCPYFCSTFFRRQALVDAGLESDDWNPDCIEFELWCRLAAHSIIKYVPGIFSKYASHPDQSSNKPGDAIKHMRGRLNHVIRMCSDSGFLGANPLLCVLFIWGHARCFCNHAMLFKRPQIAEATYLLVKETLAGLPAAYVEGLKYDEDFASRHPGPRGRFVSTAIAVLRRFQRGPRDDDGEQRRIAALLRFPRPPDAKLKGQMYARLALRYEALGRLSEAVRIWQDAAVLNQLVARADLEGGDRPPVGYRHIAN